MPWPSGLVPLERTELVDVDSTALPVVVLVGWQILGPVQTMGSAPPGAGMAEAAASLGQRF